MLYLIGLGLNDENDISEKAKHAIERCEKVYCEFYTNVWNGSLASLERIAGKSVTELKREKVESDFLINEAKRADVALLIPGDPLTATTHIELMLEARKQGVGVQIVHASSIYTAIAKTGLQIYKFGRTTTLPRLSTNFNPASPIDVITENKKAGLHTLVLLDIGMTAKEATGLLSVHFACKAVACCRLGGSDEIIKYAELDDLSRDDSIDKAPAVIIIPGELHFKEEEALNLWI